MSYETDRLLEKADDCYLPTMAIIVYESEEEENCYLESRDIDRNGKMGAGVPLSRECISELADSFSVEHSISPHGRIPDNLLYADNRLGHEKYSWYNPPQKRVMYFASKLNIPDGAYHVPGLLYVAHNNNLDLYAFKGSKPVKKLYKAPFFNTSNGSVCLGNSSLTYPSSPSYKDIMDYWEKKFWLTQFSHLGGNGNPTKTNLSIATRQWKDEFDYSELIPMTKTLQNIVG